MSQTAESQKTGKHLAKVSSYYTHSSFKKNSLGFVRKKRKTGLIYQSCKVKPGWCGSFPKGHTGKNVTFCSDLGKLGRLVP